MSVELTVQGAASFRELAARCRKERAEGRRRISGAMQRGARGLRDTVPAAVWGRLPSGYAGLMAASVAVSTSARFEAGIVILRVYAKGRVKHRDVAAVDAGVLRHPRFGDQKHWYPQAIRPGFVDTPWRAARQPIVDEVLDELGGIARRIARGG